jgi:ATP-dependent Clp protease adaptor protein ClpS
VVHAPEVAARLDSVAGSFLQSARFGGNRDVNATQKQTQTQPNAASRPRRQPPYHVILLDDDDHTYEYVIRMLRSLFGYTEEKSYQLARAVDTTGRVIVDTTTRERAEFKQEQIHAYGPDARIPRCKGSMSAVIEPAEDG